MAFHPHNFEHAMGQAITAVNGGRLDIAEEICKSILQQMPTYAAAHQLLAVVYLNLHRVPAAEQHILSSLRERPDHMPSLVIAGRIARAGQDLIAAAGFFGRAANLAPAEAEPQYLCGLVLLEQEQLAAAVEVLERLVQSHPLHALGWCCLGSAFQRLGLLEQAGVALQRSTQLEPRHADAWFNLGLVRQDVRDFQGAAEAFRTALQHRPDYVEAAVNLGIVLQERGALDDAIGAYRRAYQLRADTFGRIANALTSGAHGRMWLDLTALRRLLAA